MSVLIVSCDAVLREEIAECLSGTSESVFEAEDSFSAIVLAERVLPATVFIDIALPFSGLSSFKKELKRVSPECKVVAICSKYTICKTIFGENSTIYKPVVELDVLHAVGC